jgi:hypothetical protein
MNLSEQQQQQQQQQLQGICLSLEDPRGPRGMRGGGDGQGR